MTIKRNSVFLSVEQLVDTNCSGSGEILGYHKDDNRWLTKASDGKIYCAPPSSLRNDNFCRIINQYSMSDIIYYLMDKNPDYQTVPWELLEEAVDTTFRKSRLWTIEDIYNYITEYLI